MKLMIDYYQLLNTYKERITSMTSSNLSFVELLVLYSIFIGNETRNEIEELLQKDRSQIHRVLKKLTEKKLVIRSQKRYSLTQTGINISKELTENNEKICSALNNDIDISSLHQTVKLAKKIISI